jgi:hypothetical protein
VDDGAVGGPLLTWIWRISIAVFMALAGYLIWRTLRDYSCQNC